MDMVEGIGDEVLYCFGVLAIMIVCLILWWTTRVSEDTFLRTVFILERWNFNHGTRAREARTNETNSSDAIPDNSSNVSPMDSTTNENEASVATPSIRKRTKVQIESAPQIPDLELKAEDNIRIKLKFLDDEIRSVEGNLKERLADFMSRTFQSEHSHDMNVRLIFKGKVLVEFEQQLDRFGFFDDCVVHCLTVNRRNSRQPGRERTSSDSDSGEENTREPFSQFSNNDAHETGEWNLSKMLVSVLVLMISTAWYVRLRYNSWFTSPATTALAGITITFMSFMLGAYYSVNENNNNNNNQNQNNNNVNAT